MMSISVLHFEHEGVGILLRDALNRLGVLSRVLETYPHPFGFEADYRFHHCPFPFRILPYDIGRWPEWRRFYGFGILHSHSGSRLPEYVLSHWKGKMVQHYHNSFQKPIYKNIPSLVSVPSLLDTIPESEWLPFPIDTNYWLPTSSKRACADDGKLFVGYYDLPRDNRTTNKPKLEYIPKAQIQRAIASSDRLVDYPIQRIIPYENFKTEYCDKIDIWVDRIGTNFYGLQVAELASMGKIIVTQIGEEESKFVRSCPFFNVDNREEELGCKNWDPELSDRTREYIINVHHSEKIALQCIQLYSKLHEG